MTKITFALAAALLAGTAMTNAANADAVRVGFGFPLGSFVAHSNESYGGQDYRRAERPRTVHRGYRDAEPARKVVKVKRPVRAEVVEASVKTPAVHTAKLEDKLSSDPATTTVIEKTPVATGSEAAARTTTGSITSSSKNSSVNSENVATAGTPAAEKADTETATTPTNTKHVCRRYVPAIAELVDVPCE